jgi:hypothetical protein
MAALFRCAAKRWLPWDVSEEIVISSQALKDSVLNEVRQKFGVDGHFLILYECDGAGNRTAKVDNGVRTEYDYDANDRLLSDGSAACSCNPNGSLIGKVAGTEVSFVRLPRSSSTRLMSFCQ